MTSDLMVYSRIEAAASAAGASIVRVDSPWDIAVGGGRGRPDLVLVDWAARQASWPEPLRALREHGSRVIPFGPHTDLEAHAAAKSAGIAPMWARSKLVASAADLMSPDRT